MYCLDVFQVIEPNHDDDKCDSKPNSEIIQIGENAITSVQPKPIVNKNSTKEPNHKKKAETQNQKSKAKFVKTPPVKKRRVHARPVDEDIELQEKWKFEFKEQKDRKLIGEKRFRILKAQEVAPKLQELDNSIKQLRGSRI